MYHKCRSSSLITLKSTRIRNMATGLAWGRMTWICGCGPTEATSLWRKHKPTLSHSDMSETICPRKEHILHFFTYKSTHRLRLVVVSTVVQVGKSNHDEEISLTVNWHLRQDILTAQCDTRRLLTHYCTHIENRETHTHVTCYMLQLFLLAGSFDFMDTARVKSPTMLINEVLLRGFC